MSTKLINKLNFQKVNKNVLELKTKINGQFSEIKRNNVDNIENGKLKFSTKRLLSP